MVRVRITVNVLRAPVCVCSPTAPIPHILSGRGAGVCGVVVVVEQGTMAKEGPASGSFMLHNNNTTIETETLDDSIYTRTHAEGQQLSESPIRRFFGSFQDISSSRRKSNNVLWIRSSDVKWR